MNLHGLETFLAIVETGSLVRASERLNVGQSTVTARLKTLEADVGQRLLTRHKSGVELTAAGTRFHKYAEVMTNLWQQAQQETNLPDGIVAICNIGCHTDLWPTSGRALFDQIHQRQPSTGLGAWPGEQAELDRWFGAGLVDVALSYESSAHDNQLVYTLPPEQLVLVTADPESPMRFDPGYVFVEAGDEFRRQHAEAYADADTAKVTFGSAVWARQHLVDHGGSAYLPNRLIAGDLDSGVLHPIPNAPEFSRNVYLVTTSAALEAWDWLPSIIDGLHT